MTPAEIKKTRLYRTLAPCVRKEDREELARMLAMVDWKLTARDRDVQWSGLDSTKLIRAFYWEDTPQGHYYWKELSDSLNEAGFDCG